MPRDPKRAKSREAKPPVARKSPKDAVINRDFEARLAEALRDKAEALTLQAEAQEQQRFDFDGARKCDGTGWRHQRDVHRIHGGLHPPRRERPSRGERSPLR